MTHGSVNSTAHDLYARKPAQAKKNTRPMPPGWVCAKCVKGLHGSQCTSMQCGCERCNRRSI